MIHIVDTGPLVAAFHRPQDNDPFTPWAAKLIRSLPYPLFTCFRLSPDLYLLMAFSISVFRT
jgi:hypothetical protein